MNDKPHTHKVVIERRYSSIDKGPVEVTYGDTTVSTARWIESGLFRTNHPSNKRVRKTILKAIRRHDKGSRRVTTAAAYQHLRTEFAELPADRWASEVLAGLGGER